MIGIKNEMRQDKTAYQRAYRLAHKEKIKARDKVYKKEWRLTHKEHIKAYRTMYELKHKEQIRARIKAYYLAHPEKKERHRKKCKAWSVENRKQRRESWDKYSKTLKGEKTIRKCKSGRRQLGFIPLNKPFEGSHGHHIDKERVIYIPKEIHNGIWHSVTSGKNMDKINAVAVRFLRTNELNLFY
jgi:hypothetical protein